MPRIKSTFPPKTDFYSKYGAGLLADHINAHWKGAAMAERYELWTGSWGVRSNLVNGLPPTRKATGRYIGLKSIEQRRADFLA